MVLLRRVGGCTEKSSAPIFIGQPPYERVCIKSARVRDIDVTAEGPACTTREVELVAEWVGREGQLCGRPPNRDAWQGQQ